MEHSTENGMPTGTVEYHIFWSSSWAVSTGCDQIEFLFFFQVGVWAFTLEIEML